MKTSYCHDITTLGKVIGKDQGPSSPMNAINKRDAVIFFKNNEIDLVSK